MTEQTMHDLSDRDLDDQINKLTAELQAKQREKYRRNFKEQVMLLTSPLADSDAVYEVIQNHGLSIRECRYFGGQLASKFAEIFQETFAQELADMRQKTKRDSEARRERRNRQKAAPTVDIIAATSADNIPPEMRTY